MNCDRKISKQSEGYEEFAIYEIVKEVYLKNKNDNQSSHPTNESCDS